jgi:hypothetical protein
MLAEIESLEEAQQVRDYAAAAADLAKRAKLGVPTVNHAVVIRLLAERRLAEIVDAGQAAGEIAVKGHPLNVRTADIYQALGIDRKRLAEARQIRDRYEPDELRTIGADLSAVEKLLTRQQVLKSDAQRMQSSESNEWWTPEPYITAARAVLGGIDLDPASCARANETVQAARYCSVADDGLKQEWKGRVWLNPPYGGKAGAFVTKLADSVQAGDVTAAVCLVSSHSTDTAWFRPLWDALLCFTYGRIHFNGPGDAATHGSVLAYFGPDRQAFADEFAGFGAVMTRWT